MDGFVQSIKQYPGQQQVDRSVKVKVPGKHFPQLQPGEQKIMYTGMAVEFCQQRKFELELELELELFQPERAAP